MGLRASYLFSALIALTCLSSCASRDLFSSDSIARPLAAGLVNIILPEASCTGVQINALRAITAAHCLYNRKGGGVVSLEEIRVVKDVGPPHVSLRVSSAEMFPGFAIASRAVDNFNCSVPDDHIDPRRLALFMARSLLREIRDGGTDACSTA